MKTAGRIFWHDLKALARNPFAFLVVFVVVILPVAFWLYATATFWSPYSHTDTLKVAVVNDDAGVNVSDVQEKLSAAGVDVAALSEKLGGVQVINVGTVVTNSLKDDRSFNWQTVNRGQAEEGLASGEYFAEFILPEGFTANYLDALSGGQKRPSVDYWASGVYGASDAVVLGENAGSVDAVASRVFSVLSANALTNTLKDVAGGLVSAGASSAATMSTGLDGAEQDLKTVDVGLNRSKEAIVQWRTSAEEAQKALDELKEKAPALREALAEGRGTLEEARKASHEVTSAYGSALSEGDQGVSDVIADAAKRVNDASSRIFSSQKDLNSELEKTQKALAECKKLIAALVKLDPDSSTVSDLDKQADKLQSELDALEEANKAMGDASGNASEVADELSKESDKTREALEGRADEFNHDIMPRLETSLDSLALAMGALEGMLGSLDAQIAQAKTTLVSLSDVLQKTDEATAASFEMLKASNDTLASAKSDVLALANAKAVEDLSQVPGIDIHTRNQAITASVNSEIRQAYPLSSFGLGMAPYFACLALWAGCLMLVVVLKVDTDPVPFSRMRPWQGYVGRMLLFGLLSGLQGLLVALGALALGVQGASVALLALANIVTALCFMGIVFALAKTLRHVGKAVAAGLLVVQVLGASGMYPPQLMPPAFQAFQSWMPFTYGMGAMREAIHGFYRLAFAHDVLWLIACGLAVLALALVVQARAEGSGRLFYEKLGCTGLFDAEALARSGEVSRESSLVRAARRLLEDEDERSLVLLRVRKFSQRYSIMRVASPVAVVTLIAALVIVSSLLPLTAEEKVLSLALFVAAILIVFAVCLAFEYAHGNMEAQLAAAGVGVGAEPATMQSARIAAPVIAVPDADDLFVQPVQDEWDTGSRWASDAGGFMPNADELADEDDRAENADDAIDATDVADSTDAADAADVTDAADKADGADGGSGVVADDVRADDEGEAATEENAAAGDEGAEDDVRPESHDELEIASEEEVGKQGQALAGGDAEGGAADGERAEGVSAAGDLIEAEEGADA